MATRSDPTPGNQVSARARLAGKVVDARSLGLIESSDSPTDASRQEANTLIAAGLGIGAFGAASLALLGATCPLCVIAAPALVSLGVFKRLRR